MLGVKLKDYQYFVLVSKMEHFLEITDGDEAFTQTKTVKYSEVVLQQSGGQTDVTRQMYECGECKKLLSSVNSLKRHVLMLHTTYKTYCKPKPKFPCNVCGKCFVSKSSVNRHMLIHKGTIKYLCSKCDRGFNEKWKYQAHALAHANAPKTFHCQVNGCVKSFYSKHHLKAHMRLHERKRNEIKRKSWVCKECKGSFENINSLRQHKFLTHTNSKQLLKCDQCEMVYTHINSLRSHKKSVHSPYSKSECLVCKSSFCSLKNLRFHAKRTGCGNAAFKFRCYECDLGYCHQVDFQNHMQKYDSTFGIGCGDCTKTFIHMTSLLKHYQVEHPSQDIVVVCVVCKQKFIDKGLFAEHAKSHKATPEQGDNVNTIYLCVLCRHPFATQLQLLEHEKEAHSGTAFTGSGVSPLQQTLPTTLADVHSSIDPGQKSMFKCSVCEQLFESVQMFQQHEKTHGRPQHKSLKNNPPLKDGSESANFICKKCGDEFSDKGKLIRHITLKHSLAYVCRHCGERFQSNYLVGLHRQQVHDEDVNASARPDQC